MSKTKIKEVVMSKEYDKITDLVDEINEDSIIKDILSKYPELYDQLNFNEYNIKEHLEMNPWLLEQWRLLTIKQKHKYHRIEILKDEYIGDLYHNLKFENDIKLSKQEIERYYIPKDEKAIKFAKLLMKQNIVVETYEAIYEAFKTQSWTMKQFLRNQIDI
jgi:hypothetical protein